MNIYTDLVYNEPRLASLARFNIFVMTPSGYVAVCICTFIEFNI